MAEEILWSGPADGLSPVLALGDFLLAITETPPRPAAGDVAAFRVPIANEDRQRLRSLACRLLDERAQLHGVVAWSRAQHEGATPEPCNVASTRFGLLVRHARAAWPSEWAANAPTWAEAIEDALAIDLASAALVAGQARMGGEGFCRTIVGAPAEPDAPDAAAEAVRPAPRTRFMLGLSIEPVTSLRHLAAIGLSAIPGQITDTMNDAAWSALGLLRDKLARCLYSGGTLAAADIDSSAAALNACIPAAWQPWWPPKRRPHALPVSVSWAPRCSLDVPALWGVSAIEHAVFMQSRNMADTPERRRIYAAVNAASEFERALAAEIGDPYGLNRLRPSAAILACAARKFAEAFGRTQGLMTVALLSGNSETPDA
jgi:hypothetical protein